MRFSRLFCFSLLLGCAPTFTSGGIPVHKAWFDKAVNELRYQASIDLACGANELEFTLAARQGKIPTLMHADGCGKQGLYRRALRRHHGSYTDKNSTWERQAEPMGSSAVPSIEPPSTEGYENGEEYQNGLADVLAGADSTTHAEVLTRAYR